MRLAQLSGSRGDPARRPIGDVEARAAAQARRRLPDGDRGAGVCLAEGAEATPANPETELTTDQYRGADRRLVAVGPARAPQAAAYRENGSSTGSAMSTTPPAPARSGSRRAENPRPRSSPSSTCPPAHRAGNVTKRSFCLQTRVRSGSRVPRQRKSAQILRLAPSTVTCPP